MHPKSQPPCQSGFVDQKLYIHIAKSGNQIQTFVLKIHNLFTMRLMYINLAAPYQ